LAFVRRQFPLSLDRAQQRKTHASLLVIPGRRDAAKPESSGNLCAHIRIPGPAFQAGPERPH